MDRDHFPPAFLAGATDRNPVRSTCCDRSRRLSRGLSGGTRLCVLGVCPLAPFGVNSRQFPLYHTAGRHWHCLALAWRSAFVSDTLGRHTCPRWGRACDTAQELMRFNKITVSYFIDLSPC